MEKSYCPTRNEIESIRVGGMAPNYKGKMELVVTIIYRGVNECGKAYIGYATVKGLGFKRGHYMQLIEGFPVEFRQ